MELIDDLRVFVDASTSEAMVASAELLIDLLESDQVEAVDAPGDEHTAEEAAEEVESDLDHEEDHPKRRRTVAEALGTVRASDGETLVPYTFEDSDGARWVVWCLEDNEVLACYACSPEIDVED